MATSAGPIPIWLAGNVRLGQLRRSGDLVVVAMAQAERVVVIEAIAILRRE
jgi:hypothetical protein